MTLNLAIPYYNADRSYGCLLAADRMNELEVQSDNPGLLRLDGKVIYYGKVFVYGKRAATLTGITEVTYKNNPTCITGINQWIIKASLDGDMADLPFVLSEKSKFSIFSVEAEENEIRVYQTVYSGSKAERGLVANLTESAPEEWVAYLNGDDWYDIIPCSLPPPNLEEAVQFAKDYHTMVNRGDLDIYNRLDIFSISAKGVNKVE